MLATQPKATRATAAAPPPEIAIDCDVSKIFYGDFLAVRDSASPSRGARSPASLAPQDAARARFCAASTA